MQKQGAGAELQIGLSQQKPSTSSPPPRRSLRTNLSIESRASLESAERSEDPTPTWHQSESPMRLTAQHSHVKSEECSQLSESPTPGSEVVSPESDAMEGISQAEVLTMPALDSHQSYGSRLALSLGNLDMPQLLVEQDLHQADLGVCPSSFPPPLGLAGSDPGMTHGLAHWSDQAQQGSNGIMHHGQLDDGHMTHMHHDCCQEPVASQTVSVPSDAYHESDVHSGEGFRVPSSGYLIPNPESILGRSNPPITSGATLDPASFHDGSHPATSGLYNHSDGRTLGNAVCAPLL